MKKFNLLILCIFIMSLAFPGFARQDVPRVSVDAAWISSPSDAPETMLFDDEDICESVIQQFKKQQNNKNFSDAEYAFPFPYQTFLHVTRMTPRKTAIGLVLPPARFILRL